MPRENHNFLNSYSKSIRFSEKEGMSLKQKKSYGTFVSIANKETFSVDMAKLSLVALTISFCQNMPFFLVVKIRSPQYSNAIIAISSTINLRRDSNPGWLISNPSLFR